MIPLKGEIHKQIVAMLKAATENKLPVYNSETLQNMPTETSRIEYSLGGAYSTGQMYRKNVRYKGEVFEETTTEYGSSLTITVMGPPSLVSKTMYQITGLIQSTGALEQYIDDIYLLNESLIIATVPFEKAGVLYHLGKIKLNVYFPSVYRAKLNYFTRIDGVAKIDDGKTVHTVVIKK